MVMSTEARRTARFALATVLGTLTALAVGSFCSFRWAAAREESRKKVGDRLKEKVGKSGTSRKSGTKVGDIYGRYLSSVLKGLTQ